MPARKGLLAPQNNFLDTIATRFDGTHSNFVLGNAQVPSYYPIVYCSDGFCELTGYPRAQIMQRGCACAFLYGKETTEAQRKAIEQALQDKTELKLEVIFYRKDGTSFWCLLDIVPIKNEKHEVVLYLASHKEITKSKQVQQDQDSKRHSSDSSDNQDVDDEEMDEEECQTKKDMNAQYQRRRSRAVLYQLSGHYRKNVSMKSKLKLNNNLLHSSSLPEYKAATIKKPFYVVSHYGAFKTCWDWLILIVTVYVAIAVPYSAAFRDKQDTPTFIYSDVIVEIIFIIDILINFRTTFVNKKGEVVTKSKSILKHYLRGWFFFDFLAALPFDVLYALNLYSRNTLIHLLKLTRLVRLFRLYAKMDRYSQYSFVILILLMLLFSLLAHGFACIWYIIASEELNAHPDWNHGWISQLSMKIGYDVHNASDTLASYITALYFTTSSLTSVGFGNVSANTNSEKIFSVIVMLIGALMHAVIFGNVTAIIQRMYARRSQYQTKLRDLKDFFRLHQIPKRLKQRMTEFFQTTWSLNHGIDANEILREFPDELRGDVSLHMHREMLTLPIFETAPQGFLKLLSRHIRRNFYAPEEYLVHDGDALTYIYLVCNGSMEVLQNQMVVAILGKGDLVGCNIPFSLNSEALIKSTGDVKALTYCDLKSIQISGLLKVLRLYPEFAETFCNEIIHDLTFNLREGFEGEDMYESSPYDFPNQTDDEDVEDDNEEENDDSDEDQNDKNLNNSYDSNESNNEEINLKPDLNKKNTSTELNNGNFSHTLSLNNDNLNLPGENSMNCDNDLEENPNNLIKETETKNQAQKHDIVNFVENNLIEKNFRFKKQAFLDKTSSVGSLIENRSNFKLNKHCSEQFTDEHAKKYAALYIIDDDFTNEEDEEDNSIVSCPVSTLSQSINIKKQPNKSLTINKIQTNQKCELNQNNRKIDFQISNRQPILNQRKLQFNTKPQPATSVLKNRKFATSNLIDNPNLNYLKKNLSKSNCFLPRKSTIRFSEHNANSLNNSPNSTDRKFGIVHRNLIINKRCNASSSNQTTLIQNEDCNQHLNTSFERVDNQLHELGAEVGKLSSDVKLTLYLIKQMSKLFLSSNCFQKLQANNLANNTCKCNLKLFETLKNICNNLNEASSANLKTGGILKSSKSIENQKYKKSILNNSQSLTNVTIVNKENESSLKTDPNNSNLQMSNNCLLNIRPSLSKFSSHSTLSLPIPNCPYQNRQFDLNKNLNKIRFGLNCSKNKALFKKNKQLQANTHLNQAKNVCLHAKQDLNTGKKIDVLNELNCSYVNSSDYSSFTSMNAGDFTSLGHSSCSSQLSKPYDLQPTLSPTSNLISCLSKTDNSSIHNLSLRNVRHSWNSLNQFIQICLEDEALNLNRTSNENHDQTKNKIDEKKDEKNPNSDKLATCQKLIQSKKENPINYNSSINCSNVMDFDLSAHSTANSCFDIGKNQVNNNHPLSNTKKNVTSMFINQASTITSLDNASSQLFSCAIDIEQLNNNNVQLNDIRAQQSINQSKNNKSQSSTNVQLPSKNSDV